MPGPVCQRCGGDEIDRSSCVCPVEGEVLTSEVVADPMDELVDRIVVELRAKEMHDAADVVNGFRRQ